MRSDLHDLVVIGGGINGCGIAADAAGRGLRVLLVERDDLASGTSSASSKLIHGGLRYLEHWEFRLVRAALAEREVLLAAAPHIVWPLRFVLPHTPEQRPRWMLRAGLLLYDALARRRAIPGSRALDLTRDVAGRPLRPELRRGFAYWDCWVDDARLVVLNARAAADRGAEILTRARVVGAAPAGRAWRVRIIDADGIPREIDTRTLVNAGGPWVDRIAALIEVPGQPSRRPLRLVKGSHVVVPRIAGAEDAYLLQGSDGRVVFALPFEDRFTLIGTTDVPFTGDPAEVAIDADEEAYLLALAGRYFRTPLHSKDIVWRYAGVRPLYDDDNGADPSRVTRDWHLDLAADETIPPLLTVSGGKVTTYRLLAEEALARLSPYLPACGPPWTDNASLPGGDMPGADFAGFLEALQARRPAFAPDALRCLARRYGTAVEVVLGDAGSVAELGTDLGGGLSEREVLYLRDHEWARTADDVLWRRTKVGLHLSAAERERTARAIERVLGS
jgi:glycerol-3-phosphate dehydrogenase